MGQSLGCAAVNAATPTTTVEPETPSKPKGAPKTLREVAAFYEFPLEAVREANPTLSELGDDERIPNSTRLALPKKVKDLDVPPTTAVPATAAATKPPKTLGEVAEHYNFALVEVMEANPSLSNLGSDDKIPVGTKLRLPKRKPTFAL